MGTCCNCRQQRGRLVEGRCNTCYRFHKRTGRDRDVEQIVRTNALRLERQIANPYLLRLRAQQRRIAAGEAERLNDHRVMVAVQ